MATKDVKHERNPATLRGLRQRAEELLRKTRTDVAAMPTEDIQTLVHELQVYQTELEMQNDELHKAQVDLQEARDRYVDLYDSAPVGYLTLDRNTHIEEANLTAATLLKIERRELIGQPLARFFEAETSPDAIHLHVREAFATLTKQSCELLCTASDDSTFPAQLESCVTLDDDLPRCHTTLSDITDRKRAEGKRVSEDKARLAALVESSTTAVIGLRIDGTIDDWNPAAEQLFGYTAAEAVERNIQMLIPPQRSHDLTEVLSKLEQGETVRDYETVRLHKDGTPIDVALTVSLLRDKEGRARGLASIVRDLREQKQMEQQLAELADQERQRLGRELHDTLGQQITAVGMLASALQERFSGDLPQAELLAKLEANVEAAKQQLRLVTKGLFPVDVDANGLSVALAELANQTRETHQVDCRFESPQEVPLDDNFTATQMFLVAREAVHNAVKHAQPHDIVIQLTDHNGVRLSVRDDGVGLDNDAQNSEGMGLHIMRHRCNLIGGNLTIQSPSKGGTLLTCSLQKESGHGKN